MSLFTHLLSTLPEGMRGRILAALDQGPFADVDELRASVAGRNIEQITSFLREDNFLNKVDASALAGLLVAPTGNYISISHLIIPSSFDVVSIYLISFIYRCMH